MTKSFRFVADFLKTIASLWSACGDWILLRIPFVKFFYEEEDAGPQFAFLVHPRTDTLQGGDVYGENDIYRPFPFLRHLFSVIGENWATSFIRTFSRKIVPITLSTIRVNRSDWSMEGVLLSTVRTPEQLIRGGKSTRAHLFDLYRLATRKGVRRVGLGALLPSMTRYGQDLLVDSNTNNDRPGISTGHAYTGYVIVEFLRTIINSRERGAYIPKIAVVGAAGGTGRAVLQVLALDKETNWRNSYLHLVDVSQKSSKLNELQKDLSSKGFRVTVGSEMSTLIGFDYIVVVTAAKGALIKPEHVRPGTVIIDDSQPRNTDPELTKAGVYVIDVLARIKGLDCGFDFGFKAQDGKDSSVTFTCLAETILATATHDFNDLAVGEVTESVVERTLRIVKYGRIIGLIGELPFYSFGQEMTVVEKEGLLAAAPYVEAAQ
jgi:fatty aldehyde-generating acyl-ACP reductase